MTDVRLPDGTVVENVPEGTTKAELVDRLEKGGVIDDQTAQGLRQEVQRAQEASERGRSVGETVTGAGETALTLGTGAIAEPVAGLSGLGQGVVSAVRGDDDPLARMAGRVEQAQEGLTFQPRSETGQEFTQAVAAPFQFVQEEVIRPAGEAAMRATGSPAVGAGVQTAGEALPAAVGVRGTRSAIRGRRDIRSEEQFAREQGIDIRQRGEPQAEQIAAAGERTTDVRSRGENLPEVQQAVVRARELQKETVDRLFEEARATRAGLPVEEAREFTPLARQSVADFDTENMPVVQKRLNELDRLNELPDDASVRLQAIDQWRRRLTRNRPAKSDTAQNAAIDILKGQLDRFLEDKFTADMISGDPSAIAKWRDARGAFQYLRETFDENRVIRDIARQNATPEEMRQWVFGSSLVGAKKQAGNTVKRLKEIVGEDSPQFRGLRDDATLDLIDPLLQDTPNLKGFARNYDRLIKNNKTVANELFKPEQLQFFERLRNHARANARRGEGGTKTPVDQMAIPWLIGHGIAKGAARIRLARTITDRLRESSNKRAYLGEVFGYDPFQPIIPASSAQALGVTQAAERQAEETSPRTGTE